MELPMRVIENINQYLPYTTLRGVSKKFTDQKYCEMASTIYDDDLNAKQVVNIVENLNKVLYYQDADNLTYAVLEKQESVPPQFVQLSYKMTKRDDYYKLSIKKLKESQDLKVFDVDIMSKYQIMKSRGCEDQIKDFSKQNTLKFLLQTFTDYFNPDEMSDILYLYIYLHSNLTLLNYPTSLSRRKFNMYKLPKASLLQEIYDMYNLLYVHLNLLEL